MQVTGTRQREAWLRREFPPVEEVTSGVWSVPVPIPDSPLRYVLTYLIEHRSGFLMVDPGWDHPDSWRALTAGLESCEIPLAAITAVVITHVHPDHHGLSRARCALAAFSSVLITRPTSLSRTAAARWIVAMPNDAPNSTTVRGRLVRISE